MYFTYDAYFPGQSFYEDDFKNVTHRDIPKSATFIDKSASYPDFHGHYSSCSQIKLSKADYSELLNELTNDKHMVAVKETITSEEFDTILDGKDLDKILYGFERQIPPQRKYLYIGFYNDGQTVFVNVHVH